jgi:hypothetical protein
MTTILAAVHDLGLPTVVAAVLIYVVLRGEFVFGYPSRRHPPENR